MPVSPARPFASPSDVSLALKEQNVVCEALAAGLQVFVPRKGGLEDFDEGEVDDEGGLRGKARPFLLLPARFHQDLDTVRDDVRDRLPRPLPPKPDGQFCCRYVASVDREIALAHDDALPAITSLQAFEPRILEERFAYRTPGLTLLVLRVAKLAEPVLIDDDDTVAGCRSWVELPSPTALSASEPVLSDDAFAAAVAELVAAAGDA